jgi:predicted transcriptional regulator
VEKYDFAIEIGDWRSPAYNKTIEISLAPEVEAKLARIASEAGKATNQVVQELVANYVDHDEWFKREVQKGLDSLDGGKFVSHEHEDVGRQIERILRSSSPDTDRTFRTVASNFLKSEGINILP